MSIKLRHKRYWVQVWIPDALRAHYRGRRHFERNLETSDRREAERRADIIASLLRAEFAELRGGSAGTAAEMRAAYEATLNAATAGEYRLDAAHNPDPVAAGIEHELDKLEDAYGPAELPPLVAARVAALQDAVTIHEGRKPARRNEMEPAFSTVASDFMRQWRAAANRKPTNTEQQKAATYRLFEGFWNDKPMRGITAIDGAAFHDAMRLLDPLWARKPGAGDMTWATLQRTYGGRKKGLSQATVNRHLAALKALWNWARRRGHCEGDNPFDGFHQRLSPGKNMTPYQAWETPEIAAMLTKPPRRRDLLEVILVGMHTGMRLDEIASLTWAQVREADGVTFFQVEDAKTPAGNRQVPVHPALSWLPARTRGAPSDRLWPAFNPEGPGKKPGADAGRDFSRYKAGLGFRSRAKAFHSFRKSVTRIMEQAGVPENEWAQVFGHERGFTYRVYNPDGITMRRKAELISLIAYPGLTLPEIGDAPSPPRRPRRKAVTRIGVKTAAK